MPPSIRLSEAIDLYLDVLKASSASPSTIKTKRSTLLRFLATVGNIYPKNLAPRHVDDFLMAHSEWQPSTRKVNLETLSAFQRFCQSRKIVDRGTDILENRRNIRVPRKRRDRIAEQDFVPLLDSTVNERDRTVIALGLYLLVRVSEMISIQWKHVDLETGYIDIYRTKTQETDRLPISAELDRELRMWRAHVCEHMTGTLHAVDSADDLVEIGNARVVDGIVVGPDPEWYVACAMRPAQVRDQKGWFRSSASELTPRVHLVNPGVRIKRVLSDFGIKGEGVNMHTLRRSGAVALLNAMTRLAAEHPEMGIDPIAVVQAMLGHAHRVTTETYLDYYANRMNRDALVRGRVLYGRAESAGL